MPVTARSAACSCLHPACSILNTQFSGFFFKYFYTEKNSPARVKIEKSQREYLINQLGSTHAGNLVSGFFCKYRCQENFSPRGVKIKISQKEHHCNRG